MVEGGAPKSKMKSLSLGMRAMRSTALGASRRELMRVRLSCWVFTVMFVGGVAVKFVEEVGKERARVERRVVRRRGVVVVYIFAVVMREVILIGWRGELFYKERKEENRMASKDLLLMIKRRIVGIGDSAGIPIREL